MEYLSESAVHQSLSAGRPLEQWLETGEESGEVVLRWLRLDREADRTYSVTLFEVFNEGGPDLLDLYEFSPVDIDSPYGRGQNFSNLDEAVAYAVNVLGADRKRFLGVGKVQDAYAEWLATRP